MLVACHTDCYGMFGARAAIERVRSAGVDCIELPIRTAGFRSRSGDDPLVTNESSSSQLAAIERLLREQGVRVVSCACPAGSLLDAANVVLMKCKLDLASHFGVNVVVANAGAAATDDERRQLYACLRELGDHADRLGMTMCLDTQPGLCVNHRQMRRTLIELAHPRLRINFDTGNILYLNEHISGETALAKVCDLVRHVHLKDTTGGFGDWYFPELGAGGAVDFVQILQTLRGCAFAGPCSILIEGIAGEPEPTLEQAHLRVVGSVRLLREIGYFDE